MLFVNYSILYVFAIIRNFSYDKQLQKVLVRILRLTIVTDKHYWNDSRRLTMG